MLTELIVHVVDFSRRFRYAVVLLALAMTLGLGSYASTHFKINTNINQMMSDNLDWRKREADLERAFPQKTDTLLVVLDGATPDAAENAAASLSAKLSSMKDLFSFVERPDAIPFFRKNGLLFLSKDQLSHTLNQIVEAQPLLGSLTADPSLRGFFDTIDLMLQGVQHGAIPYEKLDQPLKAVASTLDAALKGEDQPLAWQSMASDAAPTSHDLRKFIITKPVLDYSELQPGQHASDALHRLIDEMRLIPANNVHVRLTGPIPLNDEEFASVANGTGLATALSALLVFVILLVALRSLRIVIPILLTLTVGLIATTAFALFAIGSLNLISVAFAVMFIGIAVDFGIQFGVRFRDQHFHEPQYAKAMKRTASIIAVPLAMAAGSTALGFLAFIPTAYRGVSELGLIAGVGMIIAFILNVTLLPALLAFTKPPAEKEAIGYSWAAPLDKYILKHRKAILLCAFALACAALGVTLNLRFDFDPLNLKDPHTESVSTLFDLMKDPEFNTYTVDILRPSQTDAAALGRSVEALPEVDHVVTLMSFVPDDQDAKLAMISDTKMLLGPTLNGAATHPSPTADEIVASMAKVSATLHQLPSPQPSALHLATALDQVVAHPDPLLLENLNQNILSIMEAKLALSKESLSAEHITPESITDDLKRDWVTADGRYLVQAYPKKNPRDHNNLIAFTTAVRGVAPDAAGAPISIQESGHTVTKAFVEAGIYALIAIGLLSFLILRRVLDVILLILPLLLAGILTLATIVLIGMPLNFANIIALPLLLSLGISYAIYFVSYWRAGSKSPLQSSMARAVLFSAATVLVAFGSLALSLHPGTSGMGKLLTVALVYSVICTFIILPALLGPPKSDKH